MKLELYLLQGRLFVRRIMSLAIDRGLVKL